MLSRPVLSCIGYTYVILVICIILGIQITFNNVICTILGMGVGLYYMKGNKTKRKRIIFITNYYFDIAYL